ARLPRRPGDARDAGKGRPEGRQPASAGKAERVGSSSSSSRLGALRIDGLAEAMTASRSRRPAAIATVVRAENELSSSPAPSGPSGEPQRAIVRATLLT